MSIPGPNATPSSRALISPTETNDAGHDGAIPAVACGSRPVRAVEAPRPAGRRGGPGGRVVRRRVRVERPDFDLRARRRAQPERAGARTPGAVAARPPH